MEDQKLPNQINFKKLREFMRDPAIIPSAKCVLIDLLLYAGLDGNAFPSEMTLANDLGFRSDRQVRNLLNRLKNKGWLTNWKRRGYSKSNKYAINSELYFRNDNTFRNSNSVHSGSSLPVQTGTSIPPKEVNKENQLNNTNKFDKSLGTNDPILEQTKELSQEKRSIRTQQIKDALYKKLGAD